MTRLKRTYSSGSRWKEYVAALGIYILVYGAMALLIWGTIYVIALIIKDIFY